MLHRHSIALLAAALVAAVSARAEQTRPVRPGPPRDGAPVSAPVAGTASISGIVIVSGTGAPARRARVNLSAPDAPGRTATTDEHGRFTFVALPAARYSLNASKAGHIAGTYGQTGPGRPGTPIELGDGQKFEARIQITRGSVLTGTVLDEDGEALPGTQVRALRFVLQNGVRTLIPAGAGSTDDRGIYRIFGLQPGDYVVGATPRNQGQGAPRAEAVRQEIAKLRQQAEGRAGTDAALAAQIAGRIASLQAIQPDDDPPGTGYAPVYYPGTTVLAQAAPVTLAPGEERAGLDFQLQRVTVARIEGVVVGPASQPIQNVQVTLTDLAQTNTGVNSQSARVDNDGRFALTNIAPGQYRLSARATAGERGGGGGRGQAMQGRGGMPASDVRLWAATDFTVDGRDLTNVALALQPGVSMSGRVVFEGTTLQPPADLARLRVTLVPSDVGPREMAMPVNARVETGGKFTIDGITPGRYRLTVGGAPQGWVLDSAAVDGHDSLDFPIEVRPGQSLGSATVTFTDRRSELAGALVDSSGQPATDYMLILFPADDRYRVPQSRRIRSTRPATDGRFTFGGVPPGEYKLAPIVDAEPGAWFDPGFLQQLDASALRVTVAEGEQKFQTVRLSASGRSP